MKEVYYVYNNEAIASCVLLSVIDKLDKIDIPRCCLVLPFLFDDRTTSYAIKNSSNETNLAQFVNMQPRLFASFNKRYLSLLPVMINSLMILKKGNKIEIKDHMILNKGLNWNNVDLGDRFSKISDAIPGFLTLIKDHPTEQLYKIFKVQL